MTLFCATPPHWRLNTPLFPYFRALRFGTTARLPLSSGFAAISPPPRPLGPYCREESLSVSGSRESPCRIPQGRCDRGSWQPEPCRFPRAARATRNFNSTFNPTLHPPCPFPLLTPSRPLGMECMQRTMGSSGACGGRHQGALTLHARCSPAVHGPWRWSSALRVPSGKVAPLSDSVYSVCSVWRD